MLIRFGRPRSSFTAILLLCLLVIGTTGLAHLPRLITEDRVVEVKKPENSQAFYGQLTGTEFHFVLSGNMCCSESLFPLLFPECI